MVKQKQKPISEGDWKDLRVRSTTAKSLRLLQVQLDMKTYDDVLQYLLLQEASK